MAMAVLEVVYKSVFFPKNGFATHSLNYSAGYPLHRESREIGQKRSLEHRENTGNLEILPNAGKTQGIWFAQVVYNLFLKVKDVSIFAAKISEISFEAG